jgi:hypothetical protein
MKIVSSVLISIVVVMAMTLSRCTVQRDLSANAPLPDTIRIDGAPNELVFEIDFVKGPAHNHPTFAMWLEDPEGRYLRTIYVTRSIATGIYGHGPIGKEVWDSRPGPQKRPAALPYWLHKRSEALGVPLLPDSAHPVLDGYTGATPSGSFVLESPMPVRIPSKVRLLMEINQPWDWNEYWTNGLYDDPDYRTSCQPSVVYAAMIDLDQTGREFFLNPVGHGQYAGKDGMLYTDLRTLTTALKIIDHVRVKVVGKEGR